LFEDKKKVAERVAYLSQWFLGNKSVLDWL